MDRGEGAAQICCFDFPQPETGQRPFLRFADSMRRGRPRAFGHRFESIRMLTARGRSSSLDSLKLALGRTQRAAQLLGTGRCNSIAEFVRLLSRERALVIAKRDLE